jgi:hypothetical protein
VADLRGLGVPRRFGCFDSGASLPLGVGTSVGVGFLGEFLLLRSRLGDSDTVSASLSLSFGVVLGVALPLRPLFGDLGVMLLPLSLAFGVSDEMLLLRPLLGDFGAMLLLLSLAFDVSDEILLLRPRLCDAGVGCGSSCFR